MYFTTSVLHDSTPELYILDLPGIQAYNEYYMVFNQDNVTFHYMILIKPDDIHEALVNYYCTPNGEDDVEMEIMDDSALVTKAPPNDPFPMFKHNYRSHPFDDNFAKYLNIIHPPNLLPLKKTKMSKLF